ncbi:MAG: type II toxin-antitoxin system RelE/ParE family toxin [Lentisphaerae bacterium]|nr:type II toxin-antitoxin system RelE/ParE family toxin [Lentisphaerota bacterium]
MKIKILQSAVKDLYAGRMFYERQGSGVGEYFFNSLFSDIDSLVLYAGIHQQTYGFYRLLAKRFPYAIYYKIHENTAIVFRVLDLRQNPNKTSKALRGR